MQSNIAIRLAEKKPLDSFDIYSNMTTNIIEYSERVAKLSSLLYDTMLKNNLYKNNEELDEELSPLVFDIVKFFDIGNTVIPENVLKMSPPLPFAEKQLLKNHTIFGFEILCENRNDWLYDGSNQNDLIKSMAAQVALAHHERYDGQGYPNKEKGESIPLLARICGVANTYDIIMNKRYYSIQMPHEFACAEIIKQSGKMFDPVVIHALKLCGSDINFKDGDYEDSYKTRYI